MMNTVFENIIQMSFSASFIILALCLMRLVFRRSPRWLICSLWILAALRLVLPFTIESEHSLVPSTEPIAQMVKADVEPTLDYTQNDNYMLWQGNGTAASGDTVTKEAIGTKEKAESNVVNNDGDAKAAPSVEENTINNLRVLLPYIWLIGVAAVLAYGAVGYILLYRRSAPFIPAEGKIRESEFIFSPFILGVFRPKIYLPKGLQDPIRSHVIAHENAHLQRRDHFIKPIGFIILAFHWFNPLVWLAYILLSRDIEMACDERVIGQMSADARSSYAESLLNYCTGNARVTRRLMNACPLAFGEVSMKKRIKAVINFKRPAAWAIALSLISAVLVGAMFFTNDVAVSNADEETVNVEKVKEWIPELTTADFTDENGIVRWPAELLPAGVPDPSDMIEEINLVEKMGDEVHIIFTSKILVDDMIADRHYQSPDSLFSIALDDSDEFSVLFYDNNFGYANEEGYYIEQHNFQNHTFSEEYDSYEYYESLDEQHKHPYVYLKKYADKYVTRGEQKYLNGIEIGDAITVGSTTELILTKRDDIPASAFYEYPEEDTSLGLETIEFTEWPADLLPDGFPNPYNYSDKGIEVLSIRQDDTGIILQIGGNYHDAWSYGRDVKRALMQVHGNLGNGSKYFMASENGDYVYVTQGWLDDYYSGRVEKLEYNAYTVDTFKICPFNDKVITE